MNEVICSQDSWFVDYSEDDFSELPENSINEIKKDFVGKYGDRRQEIVFIGMDMDEKNICKVLNECLISDQDFEKGPDYWKTNFGDLDKLMGRDVDKKDNETKECDNPNHQHNEGDKSAAMQD